jgi:uncharacterized YigZ family protein
MFNLQTIINPTEGLYKEQSSIFYAFAYPIQNEIQVKEILKAYRKKYYDATHICYAYRLGTTTINEKSADAGEPAHTAGTPILNQIKSASLSNILILVVRYYGGTKLGKSGLIEAYKSAAQACIIKTKKTSITDKKIIQLKCQENVVGELMRILNQEKLPILATDYTDQLLITIEIESNKLELLTSNIRMIAEIVTE